MVPHRVGPGLLIHVHLCAAHPVVPDHAIPLVLGGQAKVPEGYLASEGGIEYMVTNQTFGAALPAAQYAILFCVYVASPAS